MLNQAYWHNRNDERLIWLEKQEDNLLARQKKLYAKANYEIELRLQSLMDDLKKQNILNEDLRYIDLYQFKKFQSLRQAINNKFTDIGNKQIDDIAAMVAEIYKEELLSITNDLGSPIKYDKLFEIQTLQAVNSNWAGSHFSNRVWVNTSKIAARMESDIKSLITWGKNPEEIKKAIISDFEQSFYATDRIVRTESVHMYNQSTKTGYEKANVTKYQYLAEPDTRICDVCAGLHKKQFNLVSAIEGSNYPVMHPNCRCTTIPVIKQEQ